MKNCVWISVKAGQISEQSPNLFKGIQFGMTCHSYNSVQKVQINQSIHLQTESPNLHTPVCHLALHKKSLQPSHPALSPQNDSTCGENVQNSHACPCLYKHIQIIQMIYWLRFLSLSSRSNNKIPRGRWMLLFQNTKLWNQMTEVYNTALTCLFL